MNRDELGIETFADEPTVEWSRLELDNGTEITTIELTVVDSTLFVRTACRPARRSSAPPRETVEIKTLRSPTSAASSMALRIRNLQTKEYRLAEPVRAPLPTSTTKELREQARARATAIRHARIAAFDAQCVDFIEAWSAAGFDPQRRFDDEGQRTRSDWNALAEQNLKLAERCFGLVFDRRTVVDEEHGTRGPIASRRMAEFYRRPQWVAHLALAKIGGALVGLDGLYPEWLPSSERDREPPTEPLVQEIFERYGRRS